MDNQGSVTLFCQRLETGSRGEWELAAQAIHSRFLDRLRHLAHQNLCPSLRKRVDAEDIAQSVFKSLFLRLRDGRLVVENREDLGALLVSMTLRKVRRAVTYHIQQKRRFTREQPFPDDPDEWDAELFQKAFQATDPSGDLAVQMADDLQNRIQQLGDQRLAEVAVWKLEGNTTEEIAEKCGCSPRTIERKLLLIRKKWLQSEEREVAESGNEWPDRS